MKQLLFVNACVRGVQSRTLSLCGDFLKALGDKAQVTEVNLPASGISPMTARQVTDRDAAVRSGDWENPLLAYARQFAAADAVLFGAPYWDLSFPALLRVYLEYISTIGVTFSYSEKGEAGSLCKAKNMIWVCSAGGFVGSHDTGELYIKDLCDLFAIEHRHFVRAEGLDIVGADVPALLEPAREALRALAASIAL